jgi:hypothetical protein
LGDNWLHVGFFSLRRMAYYVIKTNLNQRK